MKDIFKELFSEFWSFGLPEVKKRNFFLPLNTGKITVLTGVRRCGKSFLMYEGMKNLIKSGVDKKNIIYLSFDDERIDCRVEDLDLILDAHLELHPNIKVSELNFFFDGLNRISGWESFIIRLHDQVTQNIYISGCNIQHLKHNLNPYLENRSIILELFPLSWNEFCEFHNISIIEKSTINLARVERHFDLFFKQGGFPELLTSNSRFHRSKLLTMINNILFTDLIEAYDIKNTSFLKFLINKIFQNNTTTISIHKIFQDIKSQGFKCSKNSIYELMEQFNFIYLTNSCLKYDPSFVKSEQSSKKTYPIDHSLLDLYDYNNINKEQKLECLVYLELRKRTDLIWHFNNGFKTDFIGKWQGKWNAIQVCWALNDQETIKHELKSLIKTCQKLNINTGWVVTRSTNEEFMMEDIEIKIMGITTFLEKHPLFSI